MYKGPIWRKISRAASMIMNNQKEIYFILITLGIIGSIAYGGFFYYEILDSAYAESPKTFIDYLIRPSLLALFVIAILILFTVFFARVLSLSALKSLTVFKLGVEFGEWEEKERAITSNFRFTSSVLKNHDDTLIKLVREKRTALPDIVDYLVAEFNKLIKATKSEVKLEIDIVSYSQLESFEQNVYEEILSDPYSTTRYYNSVFGPYNLLLGVVERPKEDGTIIVRMRKENSYSMDEYDRETLESLLAYAVNLKETLELRKRAYLQGVANTDGVEVPAEPWVLTNSNSLPEKLTSSISKEHSTSDDHYSSPEYEDHEKTPLSIMDLYNKRNG
ncbi:hypothetical protein [Halobacillus sp. K22]|uniref:hypothetical protein n=1 Tax=Halobacillus sp. K22 TaxID=3457431 RepID=UPI003FCEBBFF